MNEILGGPGNSRSLGGPLLSSSPGRPLSSRAHARATSTPPIVFAPRETSSSASSLCSNAGTASGAPEIEDKENKVGNRVTFDPNPTILLTDSHGSPLKVNGKAAPKKIGAPQSALSQQPGSSSNAAVVPVLKKTTAAQQQQEDQAAMEAAARKKPDEPLDGYIKELYAQVDSLIKSKPDERNEINEDEAEDPKVVPMVWISKWVDYSDKYGLGYQLSDDSIGVLFNDYTKLLLLPDGSNLHYIERNGQEHYHTLTNYTKSLMKKVTLLCYFRTYMAEHLLKAAASMSPRDGDELTRLPSLLTYFRTRSAIILHLTNGTFQINFFDDHTKIILCPLMGAVTYIDKKANFRTFRLSLLEEHGCSADLAHRLRYAKSMIQKTIVSKSGSSRGSSSVKTLNKENNQPQQAS